MPGFGPEILPRLTGHYDRKCGQSKTHIQTLLSLAPRRLNVRWAMLRDGTTYTPVPATAVQLPPENPSRRSIRTQRPR